METLEPLLRELATQLGVTVEYLWVVLINQAFISGIISIFNICLVTGLGGLMFWVVNKKTTKSENEYGRMEADWGDDGEFFAWLVLAVYCLVALVTIGVNGSNIITAFLNPEYWALKEVLDTITIKQS